MPGKGSSGTLSLEIGMTTDCSPSASRKPVGSGIGVSWMMMPQPSHLRLPKARLKKAVPSSASEMSR